MKTFTLITLSLMTCVSALAFDSYPYPLSFREVLASSQCVFVGTVVSEKVTEQRVDEVKAASQVRISKCLYGKECKPHQTVTLNYIAQTTRDTYLPIQFPVGQDVLVASRSKCSSLQNFRSSITEPGPDSGYVCRTFPYSLDMVPSGRKFSCINLMFNKSTGLTTYEEIEQSLGARKPGQ
jgi:hypothetical protein